MPQVREAARGKDKTNKQNTAKPTKEKGITKKKISKEGRSPKKGWRSNMRQRMVTQILVRDEKQGHRH